jgi:hypothetical protein
MRSRREILGWMSAGVATATMPDGAYAETEDIKDCPFYAAKLAAALKSEYGGEWVVNIQPEYGFAVIVKEV